MKDDPRSSQELLVAANYVEIFLVREGHSHPVGINYLQKLQIPHLPSIYGAMLAGVDYILMGAGIFRCEFQVRGLVAITLRRGASYRWTKRAN